MDFNDVRMGSKSEQIRAWAVEQIIPAMPIDTPMEIVVTWCKALEDYVTSGEFSEALKTAVEEGYSEGRFEVKEAVEEWFSNVNLDEMFKAKGWIDQKGMVSSNE